ncbi:hypothetical protein [Kitasatospora phosalacinea]|uniref:Uncharacterized protein n=1 Tax=Kitasatospora phosalacinea TaxID=2065 RepID=A0A9W6PI51_9ACTN|nr:hypothetical protein [Kitasatospora phosalacinea]GLW55465.1 hypothetical protein Kpho01_34760 [Kitasatospora phosalacinea]
MEVPTRARLEHFTEALTAGTGAVEALPPQLRYAIAGVSAYLAAVEEGAPAAGHLHGNAVALWETLRDAVGSSAVPVPVPLPPPRSAPAGAAR